MKRKGERAVGSEAQRLCTSAKEGCFCTKGENSMRQVKDGKEGNHQGLPCIENEEWTSKANAPFLQPNVVYRTPAFYQGNIEADNGVSEKGEGRRNQSETPRHIAHEISEGQ